MHTYWVSFRIHDDAGYSARYEALTEALASTANRATWWFETTSFYIFQSDQAIDSLAGILGRAIAKGRDLIVIGMPEYKTGRVLGKNTDQDIFKLLPFMKKV